MSKTVLIFLVLVLTSTCDIFAQVGIGTENPDASAVLDLNSSDSDNPKGFLPTRMGNDSRNAISSPAEGLLIYNTDISCLEIWNGTGWLSLCDGEVTGPLIVGSPCNGQPEFFTFDALEYRPIEANGMCWLDRNLGATQVATAFNDMESYGDLYQWGRAADGHQLRSNTCPTDCYAVHLADGSEGVSTSVPNDGNPWDGKFIRRADGRRDWLAIQDDSLWLGVDGVNNPCPTGFRVPTQAEYNAMLFILASPPNDGIDAAMASPLKLPPPGSRFGVFGFIHFIGSAGYYWSSTVSGANARYLLIVSGSVNLETATRDNGFSVRCIKD